MKNERQSVVETNPKNGRPLKRDGSAFPTEIVDRLLVHGEPVENEDSESQQIRYPSYRELAKRYGVSHTLIARYAKNHNCIQRRKQAKKRVKELSDSRLAEFRADNLAVERDDAIRIIDRFLVDFETAMKDGRVRCDNPSDFNLLVRLKSFLLGDADSRQEFLGGITLEALQKRHAELLKRRQTASPEMRGEIPLGRLQGKSKGDKSDEEPQA